MKILAITGNRADYDLLSNVYKRLDRDQDIELKLLITGAHLSPDFGYSKNQIEEDGFTILGEIENVLSADSKKSRVKAAAIFMLNAVDIIGSFEPDLLILAGDREEVLIGSMLGAYMSIPTIHFFGGDYVADGHVDNLARNAASKLSTYHFVSIEEHKKRLIAMGEDEDRIYVIGNPALDKFQEESVLKKQDLLSELGIEGFDEYAILIYHSPAGAEGKNAEIENIFMALELNRIKAVVGATNTDYNNREVQRVFDKYKNNKHFYFYNNLSRNKFINLYRNAKFQIGNSSSGIVEAASIPIPVINVGSRQMKRRAQKNVIFVNGDLQEISNAISTVTTDEFMKNVYAMHNEYGDGNSSERAYKLIRELNPRTKLLKTTDPLHDEEGE